MDRRPIKSRNTRWAAAITERLASLGVSPNVISVSGMMAAILAGVSFGFTDATAGTPQRMLWFLGGALCQIRLLCNLFDGMVAMKRGVASSKGGLYNEVPDRVSDAAVLIGLGYSAGGDVEMGFSAALVSVFVAYVRTAAWSLGAPNDFCGPMAKPHRMALTTFVAIYLAFSPTSWRFAWGEPKVILILITVGGMATAGRRLLRAARFLEGSSR